MGPRRGVWRAACATPFRLFCLQAHHDCFVIHSDCRVSSHERHVPFRDCCAPCLMGRGRTHHHVAKQKSEDQSRRPIVAMDFFFIKMESTPSAQAISEKSITCVAVKEDRHQNIMSSVALKKGVEESWTVERE